MKSWSKKETDIILNNWRDRDNLKILLPNRSLRSIKHKEYSLGVRFGKNEWSDHEVEILVKNSNLGIDYIKNNLLKNRTLSSIKNMAKKKNISLKNIEGCWWGGLDEDVLKEKYYEHGTNIPVLLKKYSANTIKAKAQRMGLKKKKVNNKLYKILENIPESYYWLGFLMADGSFRDSQIAVKVSIKDLNHICKMDKYFGFDGIIHNDDSTTTRRYSGKEIVNKIKEKFNINRNKTYNPCNIKGDIDDDLFFSLFVGFVDGDGSISGNKYPQFSLCSHINWHDNFLIFKNKISHYYKLLESDIAVYDYCSKVNCFGKIRKSKMVYMRINKFEILKKIKQKAIDLKLPIMERKWNNIDLDKVNALEKSRLRIEKIKNLCKKGVCYKTISNEIGLGHKYVKKLILDNGFELHDMARVPRPGEFPMHDRSAGQ